MSAGKDLANKGLSAPSSFSLIHANRRCKAGNHVNYTCFHPVSIMTCISSTMQNSPTSLPPVSLVHIITCCWTSHFLHHAVENQRCSLFVQIAVYIWSGERDMLGECIASYAEPLYPTLTRVLRRMGLDVDKGLSA
jgi:hypothetical protein